MSRAEAIRRASLIFGGLEQVKEECRDERRLRWIEPLFQDARYGLRLLRKQPAFATAIILILALGIGANTAVFSLVDAVLLKPLPFNDPMRLAILTETNSVNRVAKTGAPYADYLTWAGQNHSFKQLAAYWNVSGDGMVFGGPSSPERVRFSIVTNSFFSVLGVAPAHGRAFAAGEEKSGASKVFLVSDGLWKRNLGSSLAAIGKTFLLDGDSFTLVGVLPAGFSFPPDCDLWLPVGVLTARQLADRVSHPFWGLARLQSRSSMERTQKQMDVIASQLAKTYPRTNANWRVRVTPLVDEFAGSIRQSLLILSGAVLFILCIACASAANLLLARSERRRREFALRAALGASRRRLFCQNVIEGLLIAFISTLLALLIGAWGLRAIRNLSSGTIAQIDRFSFDGSVLVFASVLALAVGLLIGLSSAVQFSAKRFQESLREGPRSGMSPRGQLFRNVLVIAEFAITLILLCGAGLMLSSFWRLRQVDPGFHPEHVITMQIALPDAQYPHLQQRTQFVDQLVAKVGRMPGVQAAGAVNLLPLSGATNWDSISIADHPVVDWGHAPSVEQRNVTAGYFRAIGMRLVRGEGFKEGDANQRSRAVIINQCMADRFWPGVDPIGRRLTTIDEQGQWREVIGVVANVKHFGLAAEDDPEIYLPSGWWPVISLVIRGTADPARLVSGVRRTVAALDNGLPLYDIAGMDLVMRRSVASQRRDLYLLVCFAAWALLLSGAGIHGLLAFAVNARQPEIGIRMALGAARSEIMQFVMWSGMRLVLVGLAFGVLGSFALTRLMAGLLYHVSATDPLIFAAVASLLVMVAVLACWLPARRATHVDPVIALRFE